MSLAMQIWLTSLPLTWLITTHIASFIICQRFFVILLLIGPISTFITRDLDEIWQLGKPTSNEYLNVNPLIYEPAVGRYRTFYLVSQAQVLRISL